MLVGHFASLSCGLKALHYHAGSNMFAFCLRAFATFASSLACFLCLYMVTCFLFASSLACFLPFGLWFCGQSVNVPKHEKWRKEVVGAKSWRHNSILTSQYHHAQRVAYLVSAKTWFTPSIACVAGGIVGFSAHKQAAKPRDERRPSHSRLRRSSRGCAACLSRLRRSLSRLRRLLVRTKPNNTASYAGYAIKCRMIFKCRQEIMISWCRMIFRHRTLDPAGTTEWKPMKILWIYSWYIHRIFKGFSWAFHG